MPCQITWETRGVVKKFSGRVTADEFTRSVLEVHADWRFDDLRYVINDAADITGYDLPKETIDQVAAQWLGAGLSNPRIRVAFVTSDALIIGLIDRYVADDLVPCPVAVFPSVEAARAWVDRTAT